MTALKLKFNIQNSEIIEALRADLAGAQKIAELLNGLTGIHLAMTDKNRTLIAARLVRTMESLKIHSYEDYLTYLTTKGDAAITQFVSQLTTNTTRFFRESMHFKQLVPCLEERKNLRAREGLPVEIWCAACSHGQEAYSIAMTADATLQAGANFKVLASDIDHEALSKAAQGVYTDLEAETAPEPFRSRYFTNSTDGRYARVNADVRRRIEFAEFNLSSERFPFQKRFDVIFCRNVLIYFDRPAAMKVVENLCDSLTPGGYLFLGHSETSVGRATGLKSLAPAFYQREY